MSKIKRKQLKLDPGVYEMLLKYKDSIHDFESKKRVPMSWNSFFMILVSDWENSRSKCHCGHFYDCPHCLMLIKVGLEG